MNKFHTHCLVCNSEKLAPLKGYDKFNLAKCKSCGFVFMKEIPTSEELEKHYSTYSYGREQYLSPITIKNYNLLLDEFEKYRKTNRLLDVGCGMGFFLEQAKKRGWEVYGTEYSNKAVEINEAKGIKMMQGQLSSTMFTDTDFDVITSFEVIEHINNPIEEVKEINKLLRKGGLFYCTTPNFNSMLRYYLKDAYNIISYPEHLSYYTKTTLNRLLTKNGFRKKKLYCHGISFTRLKISQGNKEEKVVAQNSSDEKLRVAIENKAHLQYLKNTANFFLTLSGLGMALKGYYEKV